MSLAIFKTPKPTNEPVLSYAPGTPERTALQKELKELKSKEADIPMYIGSEEVRTGKKIRMSPPHDHKHTLGYFHEGDASHVEQAVNAALGAKKAWAEMSWEHRASIFLKAADLYGGAVSPAARLGARHVEPYGLPAT